jgi:hypothetical protein
MPLDDEALSKLISESEGFRQIDAVADARDAEVILAVTATHAGRPYAEVEAELRAKFQASGVPVPDQDFDKIIRAISDAKLPQ